jgi:ribonuclease PH
MASQRAGNRRSDQLRPVNIELGPMKFADGSALIEMGDTRVLAGATIEHRVPPFLIDQNRGWATAEYAMLPRATPRRSARESARGRPSGRSFEIQRLIGRSLRSILDLTCLPDRTLILDCDVIQADGGTRTAAITGAYVAAVQALAQVFLAGDIRRWPVLDQLAAVSVGIVDGAQLLDLDAEEDQRAEIDMNVVGTSKGGLVEVQSTGEKRSFERQEFDRLLDLAMAGIRDLSKAQAAVLGPVLGEVEDLQRQGRRKPAPPKNERDLWGEP